MADCSPHYPVAGMQAGEEVATFLRLMALMISISVLFPWLSSERRNRMRVFFLHWVSGVVYVICQFTLSVMVLNCWSSRRAAPFIYFLKFVELASLNLWSISSLAIAFLIASIVQAFSKCRRVPSTIGSARASYACVALAVSATLLSAPFWNSLTITGGYVWVNNSENPLLGHWISISFGATQMVAGFLMAVAMLFTVSGERLESLKACCQTSNRVKFHFILTIFGTIVNIYKGVTLLVDELTDSQISRRLVVIGWCFSYVHIVADTGTIFGAFYALASGERMGSQTPGCAEATNTGGDPPTLLGAAATAGATKRAFTPATIAEESPFGRIEAGGVKGSVEAGGGTVALLEEEQINDTTTCRVSAANESGSNCGDTGSGSRPVNRETHGGQKPLSSTLWASPSNRPVLAKLQHTSSRVACAE